MAYLRSPLQIRRNDFAGFVIVGQLARTMQDSPRAVGMTQHSYLGLDVVAAMTIGENLQLHSLEADSVVIADGALELNRPGF